MFSVGSQRLVCDLLNCTLSRTLEQQDQAERNCQVKATLEHECSRLDVQMVGLVIYCMSCFSTEVIDRSQGLAFSELGDQGEEMSQ